MESEKYIMYGTYFVLGIFIIYFVVSMINLQTTLVEGLTNNEQIGIMDKISQGNLKTLQKENKKIEDLLRIDKYRTDYEDYLIDLEEYLNWLILGKLIMLDVADIEDVKIGTSTNKEFTQINQLYELKKNLNTTMDYIDGKKTSRTGLF